MEPISVVIPIGPDPIYLQWLPECIESVMNQTYQPEQIILINDSANKNELLTIIEKPPFKWEAYCDCDDMYLTPRGVQLIVHETLWNVGVADAFNFGIALSDCNLVFTLGSDDKLMPTCLEECVKAYEEHKIEGWYNVTIVTSSGQVADWFNNTAMITKSLWEWSGGFPPSAGVAACDALLLSILMVHAPERMIQVKQGTPLCWLREHENQDTRKNMSFYATSGVVEAIRNMETARFKPRG